MPKQEPPTRDLLEGNPRYKKLQDLNEGTFGIVMLALDQATNERVRSFTTRKCSTLLKDEAAMGYCSLCSVSMWQC